VVLVTARWRRLRQQRTADLRQRAVQDAERARLHLVAAVVDLRRVGAPIPDEVMSAMVDLAEWVHGLRAWAGESEV
jgi:hypothetical protein